MRPRSHLSASPTADREKQARTEPLLEPGDRNDGAPVEPKRAKRKLVSSRKRIGHRTRHAGPVGSLSQADRRPVTTRVHRTSPTSPDRMPPASLVPVAAAQQPDSPLPL